MDAYNKTQCESVPEDIKTSMTEKFDNQPSAPKESGGDRPPQPSRGPRGNARGRFRRNRWRRFHNRKEEVPEVPVEKLNLGELKALPLKELKKRAAEFNIENTTDSAGEIIRQIHKVYTESKGFVLAEGLLDFHRNGFGFLRTPKTNYQPQTEDTYVSPQLIRQYSLKQGDWVTGMAKLTQERDRYCTLLCVDLIGEKTAEEAKGLKSYDELTPLFPQKRFVLETDAKSISTRVLDLLAPLGRGQRCLIVAPPRAGKTILLQNMAESVVQNDPDVHVIVLLLDERPEEVNNMKRAVKGEVIASTFDESPESHVRIAELVMSRAQRLLEHGHHVVLFLDSLTRYARACNNMTSSKGRLMSGGVESGALSKPRKFFSAARNVEEGGSLTIVATVLVETGSRADDLIFEEFKGTGNMEVYLSRDLQERRIYPAIHIEKTGTRREDLLYHPDELLRIQALRKVLAEGPPLEALEKLIEMLRSTKSNAELLMRLQLGRH
jgi:transcription termination factor Rho